MYFRILHLQRKTVVFVGLLIFVVATTVYNSKKSFIQQISDRVNKK